MGDYMGDIKGHPRSLDYSSHGLRCCDGMVQVLIIVVICYYC